MTKPFRSKREIPQDAPPWQAWLETVVVTALVFLVGRWLSPEDPFFTRTGFPWAVLAPLLAGLRHGVAAGAGSSVLLMAGIFYCGTPRVPFPMPFALAFLVVGILTGEFANMWRRRTHRLVNALEYHRLRLDEFTRTYHVLKQSFDLLNRQNLTDPHNLREALIHFRQQLAASTQPDDPFLGLAETILGLFADFSQIHAASLYAVAEDGTLAAMPSARLGNGPLPAADDALVAATLATKLVTSIGADLHSREHETQLLAGIPLVDVTGRVWGVIAVREMLFSSFQKTILQRLAVLGGHVGDLLAFRRPATAAEDFRRRIERCRSDARQFGLLSSAVRMVSLPSENGRTLVDAILEQRRGLDAAYCSQSQPAGMQTLLLLPLTDDLGLAGYRERLTHLTEAYAAKSPAGKAGAAQATPVIDSFVLREDRDFQKLLAFLDAAPGPQGSTP